jgi:hypothetical protein
LLIESSDDIFSIKVVLKVIYFCLFFDIILYNFLYYIQNKTIT